MHTRKELTEALHTDSRNLDEEYSRYAQLHNEVAINCAAINRELAHLEADLSELQASYDGKFRAEAAKSGEKFTETSIQKLIAGVPDVKAKIRAIIDKKYEVEVWEALKDSWVKKGYDLKGLSALYEADYFANSISSSPSRRLSDDQAETLKEEISAKRRRARR